MRAASIDGFEPHATAATGGEGTHTGSRFGSFAFLTLGSALALVIVGVLQQLHAGLHEAHELPPLLHWLRDSTLAVPLAVICVFAISLPATRRLALPLLPGRRAEGLPARLLWALLGALAFALTSAPGNFLHGRLFGAEHDESLPFLQHQAIDASAVLFVAFLFLLAVALVLGTPWETRRPRLFVPGRRMPALAVSGLATGLLLLVGGAVPTERAQAGAALFSGCGRTIVADVVALDQVISYNRLGVTVAVKADGSPAPGGMIYALRNDVVNMAGKSEAEGGVLGKGAVKLRDSKRPRPLVLRMNVGDCLQIHFQNLLSDAAHDDQPSDRHVGIHVNGLLLVDSASDGSFVGKNSSSLVAPGHSTTYTLYGEHENTYLLENLGVTVGSEGNGGTTPFGLFGAVNVEPRDSVWYRSQVTREDMDLASTGTTADGHPITDYAATYPALFHDGALAGRPILNMLDGTTLVHSDLNAIIAGPASPGYRLPHDDYPDSYWDNQVYNMNEERGAEPFREFTVIFHDEIKAVQAFDLFQDPLFRRTLAGVKDGFAINYGTGGIGAEIIANRIGVGPMWNCTDCKYEEFFLTSWAVGDPAMVVDNPANSGQRATKAFYADDPSNVHHSYINDRVKFRNLSAGSKEHHIFHLHSHQWMFTPNTQKSVYLDSQMIGPGSGYTYEIAFGGSGNRNKVVGDAIFHCHLYPHFAQGMWEFWRSHDTFERGTELDAYPNGTPVAGSRALPDGEITAGTPIPAVVPLPGRPMAPMPAADVTVVPYDLDGPGGVQGPNSSQLDVNHDGIADFKQSFPAPAGGKNPGFPFFIPGVAGHRPPTPPLDIVDANDDGQVEDGGLPRHVIVGGEAQHFETRLDFNKTLEKAKVVYVPEAGTPAELAAMDFHADLWHSTFKPDGVSVSVANQMNTPGARQIKGFETNGLKAVAGAPFAEPCRSDSTNDGVDKFDTTRTYKAAVVQTNAILNKHGWHFPQQRFEVLWDDVGATLTAKKAPEPLTIRLDVNDCANFWHTNLMPNIYQLDDYQVRTPTDIAGQHIHLVKFDVTSADGSGNGFNYEDGTFSPQEVVERIHAVRAETGTCTGNDRIDQSGEVSTKSCPLARKHPFFGSVAGVGDMAWGARTTIQRWYADPILNNSWDQGHGSVFTHDHFGPSTHQQVGLYSTVLVEPEGSQWRDPETGTIMGSRQDGGPTSWRADIIWPPGEDARNTQAHREFYLEFADFQHAYQAGGGKLHKQDNGAGVQIDSYADFANAINPSFRQEPPAGHEADLYWFPGICENGLPRPCPEAISADDPGTYVVNMRNEPIGLRVFDPARIMPDGSKGGQATGPRGDLAEAFQSRTDRAIGALNTQPSFYPALTKDLRPGDPWTPTLRVYAGDKVRIRTQVGATEEQHNLTIHGLKWRQEALYLNSGWRDSQAGGISEYSNLEMPVLPDIGAGNPAAIDYQYEMGHATDDLWNGIWGLLRSYNKARTDLLKLPNNPIQDKIGWPVENQSQFDQTCPISGPVVAPVKTFSVTAVRAADVLGPSGLVYNDRTKAVVDQFGAPQGAGPLIDPTAILYVYTSDLALDGTGKPIGLKPGTPVEPLVLRANAGDCIKVTLNNKLPVTMPVLPGYNALPAIVHKNQNLAGGIVSFNDNDLTPSSLVGLHPQLVAYDMRKGAGGFDTGGNSTSLVAPGQLKKYVWYAGDLDSTYNGGTSISLVARPVEFGAIGLMPADAIKGSEKGMVGALVIEPKGAVVVTDAGTRTSATVTSSTSGSFREFVTVLQTDVNLRYGGGCTPLPLNLFCAVPGITSEAVLGPAEDAEDGGQKAINYGSDPLWFRLGLAPTVPFDSPLLLGNTDVYRVYANELAGNDNLSTPQIENDPQTAVFTANAGQQVRIRLVLPGGHARGTVFALDGHAWAREPYADESDRIVPGNSVSQWVGSQEGIGPSSHFDFVVPQAGGPFETAIDYLFRDNTSFGNYQGLWGILRVKP